MKWPSSWWTFKPQEKLVLRQHLTYFPPNKYVDTCSTITNVAQWQSCQSISELNHEITAHLSKLRGLWANIPFFPLPHSLPPCSFHPIFCTVLMRKLLCVAQNLFPQYRKSFYTGYVVSSSLTASNAKHANFTWLPVTLSVLDMISV